MALYGAGEIAVTRFDGGLVLDQDPVEIGDNQASSADNVDLDGHSLAKRKGRAAYNSLIPVATVVKGAAVYYPPTGNRSVLMAVGTAVYADLNQNGDFAGVGEDILTGLSGAAGHCDLLQWRDRVFLGNNVNGMYEWTGSGVAAAVALPTAPAAAPTITPLRTQVEAFESGTWVKTGGTPDNSANVTNSFVTTGDRVKEGANSLKLLCVGAIAGTIFTKTFGATLDLSKAEEVSVWFQGGRRGPNFQIGMLDNAGAIDWSLAPILSVYEKTKWTEIRIPLSHIPTQSRTACTGMAIRLVDSGGITISASKTFSLWFDDARVVGPFHKDTYYYWYTYAVLDANNIILKESNPFQVANVKSPAKRGDAGTIDIDQPPAVAGIQVAGVYTADAAITHVLVYRYRETGPDRVPREVGRFTNTTGTGAWTFADYVSEATIQMDNRRVLVSGRLNPPIAQTYCLASGRLAAGGVTVGGTYYPSRVYLSRFLFPREFGGLQQSEQILPNPNEPGWFDLPEPDTIRRIIEADGAWVIFTDRSVWTLEGSGWDDFNLEKRAKVGLSARWAVAEMSRLVAFLSDDGVRVIALNTGAKGLFDCWRLSEPIDSLLRAIPTTYRSACAMGVDERGRLELALIRSGQTVSDAALVFDPRQRGALEPGVNPFRPGWTYYTGRGASCYAKLKQGVVVGAYRDAAQLLAGDPATGKLWYLNRSSADVDLETDDGAAIAWVWQSKAEDAGPGQVFSWAYVEADCDAAASQTITATPILNGVASAATSALALGTGAAGRVTPRARQAAAVAARLVQVKLSGSQSVALKVRAVRVGVGAR